MKIAICTDTHWGVRNGSDVFVRHIGNFFRDCFFPFLDDHDIRCVLHLGDVFDNRKHLTLPTIKAHQEQFIEEIVGRDIQAHIIAGNHDTFYKNTNALNSVDLIYDNSIFRKHFTIYDTTPTEVDFDGLTVGLCPWIPEDGIEPFIEFLTRTSARVLAGHFEIKGFAMYKGQPSLSGVPMEMFEDFTKIFSGHFHHRSTRDNISYLGCPYQLTWSDFEDPKGFHVFDTETLNLEFIENPVQIFKKVIYNSHADLPEKHDVEDCFIKLLVEDKNNVDQFDAYVRDLTTMGPAEIRIVDAHLNKDTADISIDSATETTLTAMMRYVDEIENLTVDHDELKSLLSDLYHQAEHL